MNVLKKTDELSIQFKFTFDGEKLKKIKAEDARFQTILNNKYRQKYEKPTLLTIFETEEDTPKNKSDLKKSSHRKFPHAMISKNSETSNIINLAKKFNPYTLDRIFESIQHGQFDLLKYCLSGWAQQLKPSPIHPLSKMNLIMASLFCEQRRMSVFNLLSEFGYASHSDLLYVQPDTGRNSFAWACYLGRVAESKRIVDLIESELEFDKQIDKSGNSYLHLAVMSGQLEQVRIVLEIMRRSHLDLNAENNEGMTAYHLSRKQQSHQVSRLIEQMEPSSKNIFDGVCHLLPNEWSSIGRLQSLSLSESNTKHTKYSSVSGKTLLSPNLCLKIQDKASSNSQFLVHIALNELAK